jgi:hypothetical protein
LNTYDYTFDFDLVPSLLRKYEDAEIGCKTTEAIYSSLTKQLPEDVLKAWKAAEEKAMSSRGKALDIYQPNILKSKIHC